MTVPRFPLVIYDNKRQEQNWCNIWSREETVKIHLTSPPLQDCWHYLHYAVTSVLDGDWKWEFEHIFHDETRHMFAKTWVLFSFPTLFFVLTLRSASYSAQDHHYVFFNNKKLSIFFFLSPRWTWKLLLFDWLTNRVSVSIFAMIIDNLHIIG